MALQRFKTKFPESIETVEQANQFLMDLTANDEFWHLDDDPRECFETYSKAGVKKLYKLWEQMWEVCKDFTTAKGENLGIWGLPAVDYNLETMRDINSYDTFKVVGIDNLEGNAIKVTFTPNDGWDNDFFHALLEGPEYKIIGINPMSETEIKRQNSPEAYMVRLETFRDVRNLRKVQQFLNQAITKYVLGLKKANKKI